MLSIPGIEHSNPVIIAEIGGNHGGSVAEAIRLGELAAANGADIVKYQTYTADGLVNRVVSPDRHAHFGRLSFEPQAWVEIADAIRATGKAWMTSMWDVAQVDDLLDLQPAIKVGSGDLTFHHLLQTFVRTGKPVILSTAMADMRTVRSAVDACLAADPQLISEGRLCLLQCTAQYDHPDRIDVELAVMDTLRSEFPGVSVGFSNHSTDLDVSLIALARGAEVIEVHFTTDKDQAFRDHRLSVLPDELARLRAFADKVQPAVGRGEKSVLEQEAHEGAKFHRAWYPRADLEAGHVLAVEDLVALRPERGIKADELDRVVGKRLRRAVSTLEPLAHDDVG